ncbi:hypothetical protein AB1N83_014390, partial [Pleurotus pulmonarius]
SPLPQRPIQSRRYVAGGRGCACGTLHNGRHMRGCVCSRSLC